MAKFMRKMALLAKIEAVRGTDAVPTGAANAILASNVNLTPLDGDAVERDVIRPYLGAGGSVMATLFNKVAFSVEAAGVAAAGDQPGYTALLRACAMSVTVAAGATCTFAPISDAMESVTIYGVVDGVVHKMLDAHGTVKLTADAKGIPKWDFEFTGLFVPVADVVMPVAVYTAYQRPLPVNKLNTTLTLDGYTAAASAFSFDAGNTVVKRDLIGVDSVEISNRKSVGSVTLEATSVAAKAWVNMAAASAQVPLVLNHGQAATNVVQLNAPKAELGKPTYSDSDGIQMVTLPLTFVPTSGNDEFSIVIH